MKTSPDVIKGTSKDNYLQMLKNKEQFNKKINMGGGFEVQKRSSVIPTLPGARHSHSVLETAHSRSKKQESS